MTCFHITVCNGEVCVRGTAHHTYATGAAMLKGDDAIEKGRTISVQRYGERMTVRAAVKCGLEPSAK